MWTSTTWVTMVTSLTESHSSLSSDMGVPEIGVPPIIHFSGIFHYKPSILEYPYFRKPPYPVATVLHSPFQPDPADRPPRTDPRDPTQRCSKERPPHLGSMMKVWIPHKCYFTVAHRLFIYIYIHVYIYIYVCIHTHTHFLQLYFIHHCWIWPIGCTNV